MTVNLIKYQARHLLFLIHGARYMFIVKKIAEIGEGITIVFGVMKGEGYGLIISYHIINIYI